MPVCPGVVDFSSGHTGLIHISRRERRLLRDRHTCIGIHGGGRVNICNRNRYRPAIHIMVFLGCDSACRLNRDCVFIVGRHTLLCLGIRQRRIPSDIDLPQIHTRIVRDFGPRVDGRACRDRRANAQRSLFFPGISFRFIMRRNDRLILRGNDRVIPHLDMRIRRDIHPEITARTGKRSHAHRIHQKIFAIFMIGEKRDGLPVHLHALPDIDARFLIQVHIRNGDRTSHHAACTSRGIRIRIFEIRIRRFLHGSLHRQGAIRIEARTVSHIHESFILRDRLSDRNPDSRCPGPSRSCRRFQNWRILCQNGNISSGQRRIAIDFCLGRHIRGKRRPRAGAAEYPCARAHDASHQFRIRLGRNLDLRALDVFRFGVICAADVALAPDCRLRAPRDRRRDHSTIDGAIKSHRRTDKRRIKYSRIRCANGNLPQCMCRNATLLSNGRQDTARIIPRFLRSLQRKHTGDRCAHGHICHLMGGIRLDGNIFLGIDSRPFPDLRLRIGIHLDHADGHPCRDSPAGRSVAHPVVHIDIVIGFHRDILCIDIRRCADGRQRPFFTGHFRRIRRHFLLRLFFDGAEDGMLVCPHGRSHIGLVHGFIEPRLQRDRLPVLLRLAGCERFIGIGERISEVIHRNTPGNTDPADSRCDRIGLHILHVILGIDGQCPFFRLDRVGRAQVRIRLRADDAYVNRRPNRDRRARCAVDAAHPFRHFMRRIQRHIAEIRADFHIAFRVRLRDGIQIIDIHRPGQAEISPARALHGNIRQILCILCCNRYVSRLRPEHRPVTGIRFRILDDFRHGDRHTATAAAGADSQPSVSAAKRGIIRRGKRRTRISGYIRIFPRVRTSRGLQDVGAHRAGYARLPADATGYRRIRQIRRMRRRNIHFPYIRQDPRIICQIRVRRPRKGNGGIGQSHTARHTATGTTGSGSLRKARIRCDIGIPVHIYVRILTDIRFRRVIHKCLGRAARYPDTFAGRDAESRRCRLGVSRIRRLDGQ